MSSLEDIIKNFYESVNYFKLIRGTPIIIHIDGKAFHKFTEGFDKPFDKIFIKTMQETAQYLQKNFKNCKFAYTQSDEIDLLLVDCEDFKEDDVFSYDIQKLASVSASMATMAFNKLFRKNTESLEFNVFDYDPENQHIEYEKYSKLKSSYTKKIDSAIFDSSAFNISKDDVCDYFIWRQECWKKDSIKMIGLKYFSHEELDGLNVDRLQDKLFTEKGINWNDFDTHLKRGACVVDGEIDLNIPIFTQNREYIEKHVYL